MATSQSSVPPDTLTRRSLVGTGWSTLATVARQGLSIVGVGILAHRLGPGSYGLMAMAGLVTTFLLNFRDLGTAAAIVRSISVSRRMLSTLFWVNLAFGGALFLAVLATAGLVARFFHEPQLAPVLRTLAISFWLMSAGIVHNAILSREMAFDRIGLADLAATVAGYAVAIPLAYAGWGVWSLVFSNLTTSAVTTGLCWILCLWRPSFEFDRKELRSVAGFSLNLSGFGVVNYFGRNADNIIVGRFLGQTPLGFYQMAYNLMLYPIQNISSVICQVLFPAFSKIQDDDERFRSAYVRSCMLIGLVTFPLMAGLGVVADPFIRAVLGEKWVPAIRVFQILAPVGLIQSVQTTGGQIFMAKGRTGTMLAWGIYSSTVLTIAFLIGIHFGIVGVAAAYAIANFTVILYPGFSLTLSLIRFPFVSFARQLLPQLGITLAMAVVCLLFLFALDGLRVSNAWIRLVSTSLLGAASYVFLMLWLRPPVIGHLQEVLGHIHAPMLQKLFRSRAA